MWLQEKHQHARTIIHKQGDINALEKQNIIISRHYKQVHQSYNCIYASKSDTLDSGFTKKIVYQIAVVPLAFPTIVYSHSLDAWMRHSYQQNKPIFLQIIFNLGEEDKQGNYFRISYEDQMKYVQEIQIPIDENNLIESEMMHKMAIKQEIQKIQEFARMQEEKIENLSDQQNAINKSEMISLSVNYQVITPLTSIQSEIVSEQKQEKQIEINTKQDVQESKKPLDEFFSQIQQNTHTEDIQKVQQNNSSRFEAMQLKLKEILSCFHYSGYFQIEVIGILKINLQDFRMLDTFEGKCQQNIVALKVLESQFNQLKGEWEQIFIKAINFLKQQQVDYQNIKNSLDIPQLDFGTDNEIQNDQYQEESLRQVDPLRKFIKNNLIQKRFNKIQSTYLADGYIDESILIVLEYGQEKLVFGNSFRNQLCILYMAALEQIFKDFQMEWQVNYDKTSAYLIQQNDNYNQYKQLIQIPMLNFNKRCEEQIDALLMPIQNIKQERFREFKQQEDKKRLKEKRLNQLLSTFKKASQIDKSILIILDIQNQSFNNEQLCILFLKSLEMIFNEYQLQWQDIYNQIQQYLTSINIIYDEQKETIKIPDLHFNQQIEEKTDNLLNLFDENKKRLMQVRMNQILNTYANGSIDDSLLIILECDSEGLIFDKNDQNLLCILFIKTLEELFQDYKNDWQQQYNILQYLQSKNVNYQEEKNKLIVPNLHFEQDILIKIDQKLQKANEWKQLLNIVKQKRLDFLQLNQQVQTITENKLVQQTENKLVQQQQNHQITVFKASRMKQILETYKRIGQIDQSLLIIVEYDREDLDQGNKLTNQLCNLFMAVLEKYYTRYKNEWKDKFQNTKQFLEQNNDSYKSDIEIPVMHFDQQTQDEIDRQVNKLRPRSSIYKKK